MKMKMKMMMMNAFCRVFFAVIALYYYIPPHVLMTGGIASELASFIGVGGMFFLTGGA